MSSQMMIKFLLPRYSFLCVSRCSSMLKTSISQIHNSFLVSGGIWIACRLPAPGRKGILWTPSALLSSPATSDTGICPAFTTEFWSQNKTLGHKGFLNHILCLMKRNLFWRHYQFRAFISFVTVICIITEWDNVGELFIFRMSFAYEILFEWGDRKRRPRRRRWEAMRGRHEKWNTKSIEALP